MTIDRRETALTRRRYNRFARIYDLVDRLEGRSVDRWRGELWGQVAGRRILEVGIGTGKNLPYHPGDVPVVGLDLAEEMLRRGRGRAARRGPRQLVLVQGDAQELPFADGAFDAVVTTFVFCSVPDAARGLAEVARVLAPGGRLSMLEHVLTERPMLRAAMRLLDPLVHRLVGAHIARETVQRVEEAGFELLDVKDLWGDVVKLIVARRPEG